MDRPDFLNEKETVAWLNLNYPKGTKFFSAATPTEQYISNGEFCLGLGTKNSYYDRIHGCIICMGVLTKTPPLCDIIPDSPPLGNFQIGKIYKVRDERKDFAIFRGIIIGTRPLFEILSSNTNAGTSYGNINPNPFEPLYRNKCWCSSSLYDVFDSTKTYDITDVETIIGTRLIPIKKFKEIKPLLKIGDTVKLIANVYKSQNAVNDIGIITRATKIGENLFTYKVEVKGKYTEYNWSREEDLELVKSIIPPKPKPFVAEFPYATVPPKPKPMVEDDYPSITLAHIKSVEGRQIRKSTLRKIQEIPQLKNKFHKTKS